MFLKSKYLVLMALATVVMTAQASEITVLFPRSPGTLSDKYVTMMKPFLERKGVSVNFMFMGSCADAVTQLKANKANTVMSLTNADYNPAADAECKINGVDDGASIYKELATSPNYICYTKSALLKPSLSQSSADFTSSIPLRVGAFTSGIAQLKFLKESQKWNYVMMPYTGGASLMQAVIAGDVDAVFGSSNAIQVADAGGKCIAATSLPNWYNVPHINTMLNSPIGEFTARLVWWKIGNIDPLIDKAISEITVDPEYIKKIASEFKMYPSTATATESFNAIRSSQLTLDRKNISAKSK